LAGYPTSIDCPVAGFCVVLDDFGNALVERNGSWSRPVRLFPETDDPVSALDCASAT